ncbi:MAG: tetratricopeptide repeat protein [Bryobacteraceae bacterium]|nr:tetratricopeptide repeat protein [Bryobacteraceae bacterium]
MPPQETFSAEPVRTQLTKVLASRGFARNERLSGFLRFVVEQELSGRGGELKESVIGVEYFGRPADYDVRQDSVVRNEAGKLRSRLAEYYIGEGAADGLIIDLPKGAYKPAFRQIEKATLLAPGTAGARRRRFWMGLVAALAGCAMVLSVLWWRGMLHPNQPVSIAVLPLINLDGNPDHDYFADGLTSELIRNLSIIEGLAVRSETSSFAFKGKQQNIRDAGTQLGADYILEGSVFRSGRQLRINARLVRARDDFPLWTGGYDKEFTDVFAIQDEISRGIVNGLRLKLGQGRRRYETSTDAYDLYLRARALQLQIGDAGWDQSIEPLMEAIAKDPSFAPAYASLAKAYAIRSGQTRQDIPDEVRKLRTAAEQAIRLDPLLAEAHAALGMLYAREARWLESEKSFRRAIELDPGSSASHQSFGVYLLRTLGRTKEAIEQLRLAEKNDPLSTRLQYAMTQVLLSAGRHDEAARYCNKLPAGHDRDLCLGRVLLGQGRTEEAIRILSHHKSDRGYLGYAYARSGRREEAEKLAMILSPHQRAVIFAGLGDKERAIEALDRMTVVGPVRMGWILSNPELATLRGDPRWKVLRQKVGLPE